VLSSLLADVVRARSSSIPRSSHSRIHLSDHPDSPPWNPSSQIDDDGFLKQQYYRVPGEWEDEFPIHGKHRKSNLANAPVRIRQVPGDGNCLFHSLSVCLSRAEKGADFSFENLEELRQCSRLLRQHAVDYLQQKPRRLLFLQGKESLRSKDLVDAAAGQYGCTGDEYCETMRQESYWGGGPEIVALCNLLKRPIHVYELSSHKKDFRLRRMACFGSPKFDRKEAIHILSADSRFPDVAPGRQLESGNHFLAVFPVDCAVKRKVRGGDSRASENTSNSIEVNAGGDGGGGFCSWVTLWWSLVISGSLFIK